MKRILFITAAFLLCLTACKKSKDEPEKYKEFSVTACGKSTVLTDPVFEQEDVVLTATFLSETTLRLEMKEVNFSDKMPVRINLSVSPIGYTREEKLIVFFADGVVPTADGSSFDMYKVTGMEGRITPDSLCLTANIGQYACRYAGKLTDSPLQLFN